MSVEALLKFAEDQKANRQPWDSLYQDVSDLILPRKANFTAMYQKGNRREDHIWDDMGPWALEQFANGMHAYLTSPLTRWFDIQVANETQRNDSGVLAWKEHVTKTLYNQFNSSISSFHPTVQEVYTDVGAYGYGVAFSEWNAGDSAVLYQARFPGECFLYEDLYGRVRGLVRCYELSADQFVEAFGTKFFDQSDLAAFQAGKLKKKYYIKHVVLPRTHVLMKDMKIPRRYKFGSVRICQETKEKIIQTGGFRSFPYHIARWGKRAGDVYPTSPAITALPSIRRANVVSLDLLKIANRWADPPTQGPDDEALAPYDLSPGAQNFYRPGTNDRIEAINGVLGDPSWAEKILENTHQSIMRQFYVEAFLTTADSNGQNVKATFVNQRKDERFRQLAAMLSRVERELLSTFVERTFDLAEQNGLIEEAPQAEIELDIEYLSPIVRAQRSEQLDGLFPLIEMSGIGAQYDPTVMEVFNWDNIIRDAGTDVYALPASWFHSQEELDAERQNAQTMQELQQGSEIAQGLGGALKDVADANLTSR